MEENVKAALLAVTLIKIALFFYFHISTFPNFHIILAKFVI